MTNLEFEKLNNVELIEKFEEIIAEQVGLMKEFYTRLNRKEISDSEFVRFQEIAENAGVALIDLLPLQTDKKSVEDTINITVHDTVQKAYDENR